MPADRGKEVRLLTLAITVGIAGCGYEFSPKEITIVNEKGEQATTYSCGSYMRVNSEGWGKSTYEISFTDPDGLAHHLYGVKGVGVADIPDRVDAPMWKFGEYVLGEKYMNPDGSEGKMIENGEIAVKGDNMARLLNGKWTAVKVPNRPCAKRES
jgi:hypothetical protein